MQCQQPQAVLCGAVMRRQVLFWEAYFDDKSPYATALPAAHRGFAKPLRIAGKESGYTTEPSVGIFLQGKRGTMKPIMESLPENLWKTMLKKLGREEALRLLWTTVVGPRLAFQTGLRQLRGRTVVVSVPDAQWTRSLRPLERMILDAVNRFPDSWRADSIEFVVEPRPVASASLLASGRGAPAAGWNREGFPPGRIGDEPLLESVAESEHKYFWRHGETAK